MATDDFLDVLRADWRRQGVDIDRVMRLVEQRQQRARRMAGMNMVGAGVALLFGVWFAYQALATGDALYALSGAALLIALPLILAEYVSSQKNVAARAEDTPISVLLHARDQAEMSRRLLWGCRVAAIILLACSIAVLGLSMFGRTTSTLASFLTPIWGGTGLAVWRWQSLRGRRLAGEIERCDHVLAEFDDADRAGSTPD